MKPATAAKKLGVYLEATPEEFQAGVVSRDELNALQANPPQWLADLRRNGPHPKQLIAQKLGISTSGLVRAGITEALTTEQITALKDENPDWLVRERNTYQEFKAEEARLAEKARLEAESE
ncbi:DUF5997 family protein [Lentzea sp. CA-135723]|uniref:DUF5997 family protein n=1 Tax=Lentzea sp. CA-135723 TaxID=3239950 RepID=UPI003D91716F